MKDTQKQLVNSADAKVTAKPIARFYSVTEPTIYKWAKEGKIPSIRFQNTIRFDFAAVRQAIEGGLA